MPTPTWDKFDQDCDAFDLGFGANNRGTGTVEVATFDSRSTWKFNIPITATPLSDYAFVVNSDIAAWTEGSIEVVWRAADAQTDGDTTQYAKMSFYARDSGQYAYGWYFFYHTSYSTYPMIRLTAGTGSTIVQLEQWLDFSRTVWHTTRVVINSSHQAWFYFDGQYLGTLIAEDPTTGYSANTVGVAVYGDTQYVRTTYVDSVRMSSTRKEPDCKGIVSIGGETLNCRFHSDGNQGSLTAANPADPVRIRATTVVNGAATYALPVVDTSDTYASKVRIRTADGTKALQKYPTF